MLKKLHKIKREKKTTCINTKKKEEDNKREITDQRTIRLKEKHQQNGNMNHFFLIVL